MGGSAGGNGRTPYEAPESGRSKQRVKIVEVISEGEVLGFVNGSGFEQGFKSIFLDNTPVQNEDGTFNFKNMDVEGRIGTQAQTPMREFGAVEKEVNVGTEVKKTTPLTRTVTDSKVTRLRLTLGVSSLFSQNDQGDTNGSSVVFQVTVGSRRQTFEINGKYSSQYLKNLEIKNLPPVPFTVKVERVTADSTSQRLQNKTVWSSYTEIIDSEFAYPNTAVIGVKFDSEYFSSIPTRTYEIYGIKVKVPSNYNPQTRTYSGLWDGTFKIAWTDNPAWIIYDIVSNKRYGLGQRLGEFSADKWTLYTIAQYCDQLVPDGFGGKEPRFTCNLWLTEQRSAYDVLADLCSIFRALAVWNGTQMTFIIDRPADPVWTYTNANVIEGKFSRQYSAMKSRHNAIQVEYKDRNNNYDTAIEYVSDDEQIRKFGLNLKKVTAYGCTSRGQAFRTGKWLLETEKRETETITFSVGAEGLMHLPGDIIRVADSHYAGTEIGGRVVAINGRNITLDREISLSGTSYFQYINAQAKVAQVRIQSVNGKVLTLTSDAVGLEVMGVWSLATEQVTSRLYRAMAISEEDGVYTITALQHEPQKEAVVDNGAVFEPVSSTLHQMPVLESVNLEMAANGIKANWNTTSGDVALTYDVRLLKGGKLYAIHKGLKSLELSFDDLLDGDYTMVVQAKNARGQVVSEKVQNFTINRPPAVKNARASSGLSEVLLSWDYVDDTTQTEIWASSTNNLNTAKRVAKVLAGVYTHAIGAKQVRFYWLRHTRGQNVGAWYQPDGLRAETSVDIAEELRVLNTALKTPIINEVFDVAAPARGLEMVKTVATLNVNQRQGSATLVYNQADKKLYRWNGTKYTAEIPSGDIAGNILPTQLAPIPTAKLSGVLADNQIPAIPTNKLSGVISDAQIATVSASKLNGSIDLAKIPAIPTTKLSGTVSAHQISANAIGANHIASNAITAEKVAAGTLTARELATNAVTSDKISANAITATKLATNAVTADKIAANAVNADNIAANAITSAKISANSIGANHLQANSVVAGKLAANAVTAGAIQAGAIRANHISAGQVSADKLAIGLGGNLLYNPIFDNDAYGWSGIGHSYGFEVDAPTYTTFGRSYHPTLDYHPKGLDNECWRLISFRGTTTQYNNIANNPFVRWVDVCRIFVNVVPNQWYMFSSYIGGFRCAGRILVEKYNKERSAVQDLVAKSPMYGDDNINHRPNDFEAAYSGHFRQGIGLNAKRGKVKFKAPDTGVVLIIMRISRWALNFNYGDFFFARPMLEECTEHATEPSPWQNAGVTAIHGGSIITETITANKIGANQITANHITAGAVSAEKIAARSITGDHVAARSLSAEKLNVESLSAISANIGDVRAGNIRGVNIEGTNISGSTITGTNISGGVITGARFIGATGDFTGTLVVSSTLGAQVAVYEQHTNYVRISSTKTGSRHCYEDHNNSKRRVCTGDDTWQEEYRSEHTFHIPAMNEETVMSMPEGASIVSITPEMRGLIGDSGRVVNSGTAYTVRVASHKTVSTLRAGSGGPQNHAVRIRRNRRF